MCLDVVRFQRSLGVAGACGFEYASHDYCEAAGGLCTALESVSNYGCGVELQPELDVAPHASPWSVFNAIFCVCELVGSALLRAFDSYPWTYR